MDRFNTRLPVFLLRYSAESRQSGMGSIPFSTYLTRLTRHLIRYLPFVLILPDLLYCRDRAAEKLCNQSRAEETAGHMDRALMLAAKAVEKDPGDPAYVLQLQRARFKAAAMHIDQGRQLAEERKYGAALTEFETAFRIDPSSDIAAQEIQRTKNLISNKSSSGATLAEDVRDRTRQQIDALLAPPELRPLNGEPITLRMNNSPRVLFETTGKIAGINVLFDPEYNQQQPIRKMEIDLTNTTLEDALDQIALCTKSFWRPVNSNTIFVTLDNPAKRRDYAGQLVKIYYLSNLTSAQELQEVVTTIRQVVDVQKISVYSSQNAVVVRAEADTVALVDKILHGLDKPRAEVVIDVMVLQVSTSWKRDLGIAFAASGINTSITFAPRSSIATSSSQLSTSTSTSTSSSDSTSSTTSSTTSTAIPISKFSNISSADYSVVNMPGGTFEAVLTDSGTRILQSPQVRAVDNAKAVLKIGDRVPTATGSYASSTTAVTSALVSTQFAFIDVGVNIEMTPKVHDNNEISMHLDLDISQVKDRIDIGGISQPEINQNKATADIRMREGEVNLIAGLIQNSDSKSKSGVPGLANLPLFGRLFSSESLAQDRTELLIALIPHIVRGPAMDPSDMRAVSSGTASQIKVNRAPAVEEKAVPPAL